jgi:hypothetical protein
MFCQRLLHGICISVTALTLLSTTGCNAGPNLSASPTHTPTPIPTLAPTPDIPSIISAMSPVVSGQGLPEAALYDPNKPGPHHVVILTTAGLAYSNWNELLPYDWSPSSVDETELVVLIGPERERALQTQQYERPDNATLYDVTAYSPEVDVELREARTGRTLATSTFTGSDPRPFPESLAESITRLEGSVVYTALEDWLCPSVTPQACWTLQRTLEGHVAIDSALSPDGQILAVRSIIGDTVQLWQVSDGTLLRTLAATDTSDKGG